MDIINCPKGCGRTFFASSALPNDLISKHFSECVGAWVDQAKDECQNNVDQINHPSHYTYSKIEPIDVIEAWGCGFHIGNAIKYLSRAGKKDPSKHVEDLKKAAWYIKREIERLEKENGNG